MPYHTRSFFAAIISALFFAPYVPAQEVKKIGLKEAIELGLANNKSLKLDNAKIEQVVSQYRQVKDRALPTGSINYIYNHAEIPANKFVLTDPAHPLVLPKRADIYLGTFSLQEIIFSGNKFKYAKESSELLTQVARLDIEKDKEQIVYNICNFYYMLYKLQQSKKVIDQNIQAMDRQIHQSQRFFEQGLVTKNDVLRFQLQRSNLEISNLDLETNRKIVAYNMDILLGISEKTDLVTDTLILPNIPAMQLEAYLDTAFTYRTEIKNLNLQNRITTTNIKSIRDERLPSFVVGANMYYINPALKFIPTANTYLFPITMGGTLSWNFDRLWTNKNRVGEAKIQRQQIEINQAIAVDNIKSEVNQNYQNYVEAVEKIRILETSIAQASENDKIVESKYDRNVASVTDRVDANAQLYQAEINLEIARADAGIAYFALLKSTGTIAKNNK
jgi:outer membrane protein